MVRRLVVVCLVLLALLVALDRIGAVAADHVVAGRLQAQEHLSAKPSVSIGGVPFLTQAIGGRYDDVTVTVHDYRRGVVPITVIRVELHGVHVPLSAVFAQHLKRVQVDRAAATLTIDYADLNAYLRGKGVSVAWAGGSDVRISGSLDVLGRAVSVSGTATVDVQGNSLLLPAASAASAVVAVPLAGLPFGIRVTSAKAAKQGIVVAAAATDLVIRSGG